ncbi:MAG: hypothetical protein JWL60_666 [Gemmatimonadetes bacterium]|jgi:hypothetical protein|nr:hypothetical protein [Gemmatimonadota bacterium]
MPQDEGAVRALVGSGLAGTRYLARAVEQLEAALQFEDPEYLAVLAERGSDVVALALFGTVAGASRCSKLHLLLGEASALGALAEGITGLCADSGERLLVSELPDDATFRDASDALAAESFVEEGRVPDYVADGIALRLLVWRR